MYTVLFFGFFFLGLWGFLGVDQLRSSFNEELNIQALMITSELEVIGIK
jgi:hypothetical protein